MRQAKQYSVPESKMNSSISTTGGGRDIGLSSEGCPEAKRNYDVTLDLPESSTKEDVVNVNGKRNLNTVHGDYNFLNGKEYYKKYKHLGIFNAPSPQLSSKTSKLISVEDPLHDHFSDVPEPSFVDLKKDSCTVEKDEEIEIHATESDQGEDSPTVTPAKKLYNFIKLRNQRSSDDINDDGQRRESTSPKTSLSEPPSSLLNMSKNELARRHVPLNDSFTNKRTNLLKFIPDDRENDSAKVSELTFQVVENRLLDINFELELGRRHCPVNKSFTKIFHRNLIFLSDNPEENGENIHLKIKSNITEFYNSAYRKITKIYKKNIKNLQSYRR